MAISLLKYTLLFISGSMIGWVIEFFWRRFFDKTKRWGNPGFLSGPWLPVYGFGTLLLFYISNLNISLYFLPILIAIILTSLEYVAGIIFLKVYKIRLWDYTSNRFNVNGLICPFYSFLWMLLGIFFYLIINPVLNNLQNQLFHNLEYSFFIGLIVGIYIIDLFTAFNLAARIKKIVSEIDELIHLDYEVFKLELRDRIEKGVKNRTHFLLPFNGEMGNSFKSRVIEHKNKLLEAVKIKKK